jgi:hypothetical protein
LTPELLVPVDTRMAAENAETALSDIRTLHIFLHGHQNVKRYLPHHATRALSATAASPRVEFRLH